MQQGAFGGGAVRKSLSIALGVPIALVLGLVAVPAFLDLDRYKPEIVRAVRDATGRDLALEGPLSLRLLPVPRLGAKKVSLANLPGSMVAEMVRLDEAGVRLAVLPLLAGRIEVESVTLLRPTIRIETLADGRANWRFTPPTGAQDVRPASAAAPGGLGVVPGRTFAVDRLTIVDGALDYVDAKTGTSLDFTRLNLTATAGSLRGPVRIEGDLVFRRQLASARFVMGALPERGSTPATASIELRNAGLNLDFSGLVAATDAGPAMTGTAQLTTPNLAAAMAALGGGKGGQPALPAQSVVVHTKIAMSPAAVDMTELRVTLGETYATGSFNATFGDSPRAGLTLDFGMLDLDKLVAALAGERKPPPSSGAPVAIPVPSLASLGFTPPKGIQATVTVSAEGIRYRAGIVRAPVLAITLVDGALWVDRLTCELPGNTVLRVAGRVAADAPDWFNGRIEAHAGDPRGLLRWLGIDLGWVPADRPRAASVTGNLVIDRTRVRVEGLNLQLDQIRAAGMLSGDLATAHANLDAAIGSTAFNLRGEVTDMAQAPRYEFGLAASDPDIGRLLGVWLPGYRPAVPLGGGTLVARIAGSPDRVTVEGLKLAIGPRHVAGEGTLKLGGPRPMLTARLAGDNVVVDDFLPAASMPKTAPGAPTAARRRAARVPEPRWSREPLDPAWLRRLDADIEMTLGSLTRGHYRIEAPVLAVTVVDGVLDLRRFAGSPHGGTLEMTGRLAAAGPVTLSAKLVSRNVDLARALGSEKRAKSVGLRAGIGEVEATLSGQGTSALELVRSLTGEGRFLVRAGVVSGFDLRAASDRLGNIKDLAGVRALLDAVMGGGESRFTELTGGFQIAQGIGRTTDIRLMADGAEGRALGSVNLPLWEIAMTTEFRLTDHPKAPPFGMRLTGALDDPEWRLDARDLQAYLVERLGHLIQRKGPSR